MASTPRTGSTLLCRLLWDTERVGAPKEYCNPMQMRDWAVRFGGRADRALALACGPALPLFGRHWTRARMRRHLDTVIARRTGADGHLGLKIHAHHMRRWSPLLVPFHRAPVVRIFREDRVGQAISWVRARQTNQWTHHQRPQARPRYDERAIDRAMAAIDADEAWWDDLIGERTVLRVTYEALVTDPAGVVRAVLAFLDADSDVILGCPPMRRQADDETLAWRTRYLKR